MCGGQKEDAGDHHNIEEDGAEGGDEEVSAGVGHADEHGGKAHEQHVGEHEAQQLEHEPRLLVGNAEGQGDRNADDGQDSDHSGSGNETGDDRVGRTPHLRLTFFDFFMLEDRNECRGKSAFPEQPAEEIGNLKGESESAGNPGVAHEGGIDHLAHHAQNAAGEGGSGHRARRFQHLRHRARRLKAKGQRRKKEVGPVPVRLQPDGPCLSSLRTPRAGICDR